MRVTHAINNIYKLISFFELIEDILRQSPTGLDCMVSDLNRPLPDRRWLYSIRHRAEGHAFIGKTQARQDVYILCITLFIT